MLSLLGGLEQLGLCNSVPQFLGAPWAPLDFPLGAWTYPLPSFSSSTKTPLLPHPQRVFMETGEPSLPQAASRP